MDVLANKALNYSIILNRNVQLKVNDNTLINVEIEIFVFKDDDGNLKIEAEHSNINNIVLNGRKINNSSKIDDFISEFNKNSKTTLTNTISQSIKAFYKKFKNEQIKSLVKEHHISLC